MLWRIWTKNYCLRLSVQKPACASQIVSHILRMWRLMTYYLTTNLIAVISLRHSEYPWKVGFERTTQNWNFSAFRVTWFNVKTFTCRFGIFYTRGTASPRARLGSPPPWGPGSSRDSAARNSYRTTAPRYLPAGHTPHSSLLVQLLHENTVEPVLSDPLKMYWKNFEKGRMPIP